MTLSFWDIALLLVVSAQATVLAFIRHPLWKSLVMILPIPFTLATLAVGAPLNATHALALILLLGYTHAVRLLHNGAGLPIIISIVISAAGYIAAGALLRPLVPLTPLAFWLACAAALLTAVAARAFTPKGDEPVHRSHLPFWMKFPIVAAVILALILLKRVLQGFMTMFPMVGVVASYECRFSLGSVCRALPDFMIAVIPMMAVVKLVEPRAGTILALAAGWLAFIPMLIPLFRDFRTGKDSGRPLREV